MKSSEQKKHGYSYKREDLYTCIVFIQSDSPYGVRDKLQPTCVKYRKIRVDHPATLEQFKKFILGQFPGAKYFNVYGGMSGDYYKRIYLP